MERYVILNAFLYIFESVSFILHYNSRLDF